MCFMFVAKSDFLVFTEIFEKKFNQMLEKRNLMKKMNLMKKNPLFVFFAVVNERVKHF